MKELIMINGPMGVGKTSVGKALNLHMTKSVHLDADWLWDLHPFDSSKPYKELAYKNVSAVLNNFIEFPHIEYIVFSWVMSNKMKQRVLDDLRLDYVKVINIVLDVSVEELMKRWDNNNEEWRKDEHWKDVATTSIHTFGEMDGIHVNTTHKSISEVVKEIARILGKKLYMSIR